MLIKRLALFSAVAAAAVGCAHTNGSSGSLVPERTTASLTTSSHAVAWKAPDYNNQFELAQGTHLADSDIDSYIDRSIVGADRVKLHKLMAQLPSQFRSDIIYLDKNDRAISNNPALLRHFVWRQRSKSSSQHRTAASGRTTSTSQSIVPAAARHTSSSGGCGPPYSNSGPYIRFVSYCGYTGGLGIISLDCYTSYGPQEDGEILRADVQQRREQAGSLESESYAPGKSVFG
jgi:hypothetical protein